MLEQVDILLPAYNEEKRISATIESIQKSTYTNWRLFVIDDCSTDNTVLVVERFSKNDSRIVLIRNKVNVHIAESLNVGLKQCTNEYVFRIDAGDLFYPYRIEKQLAYIRKEGADLCGGNILIVDDDFNKLYKSNNICSSKEIKKASRYINTVTHSTYCFKRESVEEVGGYRNLVPAEDYDLLIRLLLGDKKVVNCSDNLVYYHDYDLGISKLDTAFQGVLACQLAKSFRKKRILDFETYLKLKVAVGHFSDIEKRFWVYKFKLHRLWVRMFLMRRLGWKVK